MRLKELHPATWSPWLRALCATALALLVWRFRSKAIQDVLLVGAFVAAMCRHPRGFRVWLRPGGLAFLLFGALLLVTLPWCPRAGDSAAALLRYADVVCLGLAIPVLFHTRRRIESALLHSAWAVVLVLGYDLARIVAAVGGRAMVWGHELEPFAFEHSNLASTMAGAAAIVLAGFAWMWRREARGLGCFGGVLLMLAYQLCLASRGAQLALAATVVLAGLMFTRTMKGRLVWLGIVAVGGGLAIVNLHWINPRFLDWENLRGLVDRDKAWAHTIALAGKRPWFGYGFGMPVFEHVYHSTSPPESPFHFVHAHQYWLQTLFMGGLVGALLQAVGWGYLTVRLGTLVLLRRLTPDQRLLPGLILLLMAYVHIYGLADWPAGVVGIMVTWLIPVALTVTVWGDEQARPEMDGRRRAVGEGTGDG